MYQEVARRRWALRLPFSDADELHSGANKAKMTRGESLTDADRAPWLVGIQYAGWLWKLWSATGAA